MRQHRSACDRLVYELRREYGATPVARILASAAADRGFEAACLEAFQGGFDPASLKEEMLAIPSGVRWERG